ncbi:MAG: rhamnulokinase family protein [Clostridia bacterium]|nr:rhamnulokinase family protein [Clostridia bacterium]
MSRVLAFDFGASTGRAILAEYKNGKIEYNEVHRFDNVLTEKDGKLRWDFPYLLGEVKKAIELADKADSLAFDTWGVDYGLINANGEIADLPICYRDGRTKDAPQKIFESISQTELYEKTGNQIMPINTLFQLLAEGNGSADMFLFMPDLFAYALCGAKTAEQTIASTSQMLDLKNVKWQKDVFALTGKEEKMLPPIVKSATVAGEYNGIKVIKVAGHDTQCAVCAMPSVVGEEPAFLSCGTWSLIGCENDEPILTEKSMTDELSNELGANGKINYLKNISGLWLIQEIRRNFREEGKNYSYNDMEQLARNEKPFEFFIDPDEDIFASPKDMPKKIRDYCKKTGQGEPQTDGALVRCIYESLAMKYRFAIRQIEENTGKRFDVLHLLGGGTKDSFLCQMTADSLNLPVIAGPTEATALGNIILQLIALGDIEDVNAGREIIKSQENLKEYKPIDPQSFEAAYQKFLNAIN